MARRDRRAERTEACEGTDGGKQVPETSVEIAVSAAGVAGGLRVQAHSPSPDVKPLFSLGGPNTHGVQCAYLAAQQQCRGADSIVRQAKGSRQIIASSGGDDPKYRLRVRLEGVQQKLERAIAPDGKDAFTASASRFLRFLREGCGTFRQSQLDGPIVSCGKTLQIGEDFAPKPTAGGRIDEQEIGQSGLTEGRMVPMVTGRSGQFLTRSKGKNGAGGGNRTHGLGIMRPSLYH